MMNKYYLYLFISILSSSLFAQNSGFGILIKGGITDYGSVQGIQVSGSTGVGQWKIGPILGLGTEYTLGKDWFIQGTFEYSYNIYSAPVADSETMERGSNSVIDIMGNIKKRWDWFYLLAGIGFSSQNSSDSYVSGESSNGESYRHLTYEGTSSKVFTGLLGVGLEFYFFERIGFFLEGSWRFRKYVTPVAQLGISYKI